MKTLVFFSQPFHLQGRLIDFIVNLRDLLSQNDGGWPKRPAGHKAGCLTNVVDFSYKGDDENLLLNIWVMVAVVFACAL